MYFIKRGIIVNELVEVPFKESQRLPRYMADNEIKKQMLKLGRPKLKAFWHQDLQLWCALEGCHRLRIAKLHGLTPIILPVVYRPNRLVKNCGVEYYAGIPCGIFMNRLIRNYGKGNTFTNLRTMMIF